MGNFVEKAIVLMFPLSRAIGRGDLRSAGISCFIAKPLRYYRSPSLAPESFGHLLLRWRTILGYYLIDPGCFTKDLGGSGARLVTPSSLSSSMLSATPGSQSALVRNAPSVLPAPIIKGSALPKIQYSRGYGSDSEHTLFTSPDSLVFQICWQTYYRAAD